MSSDATRYRAAVEKLGLSRTHLQILDWMPRGGRVLELGCASGYHGRLFRDEKGCTVVGVEADPRAAEEARAHGLEVRVGSLEDAAFRASIEGPFDAVVAADVLEHLRDPGPVLDEMRRWVRPGGIAVLSVPNIATFGMRLELLRGRWEYQETGILDRTHLRFFSWPSLLRELDRHGLEVTESMFENDHHVWEATRVMPGPWRGPFMDFATRRWPNVFAQHFAVRLRVSTRG